MTSFEHKRTEEQDADYGNVLDINFYTLTTDKGAVDITLHVEHNGYYGGRLEGPEWCSTLPKDITPC